MTDKAENQEPAAQSRRLADVIREVKNAVADRDDVVVELREASRTRLELMAAELAPLFAEAPADIDLFDFTISSGLQPRLWIDAVSHVAMAPRPPHIPFREGHASRPRSSLPKTPRSNRSPTRSRATSPSGMIERERLMEGGVEPALPALPSAKPTKRADDRAAWRLGGLPVGARPCSGRRAGRPHRLGDGALGPADREFRLRSLTDKQRLPRSGVGSRARLADQIHPRQFADRKRRTREAAADQAQRPGIRFAGDFEQVPLRRRMRSPDRLAAGRHTDHRHRLCASCRRSSRASGRANGRAG